MELHTIRYFLAVARTGNVSRAANFLHVTQPTISRQLMELETELGVKLFERGKRELTLTAAGSRFFVRAEQIEELEGMARREMAESDQGIVGEVHIGAGETCAMRLIAAAARRIREDHPRISFKILSGNAEDVTERLDRGLLDFGLLIEPTDLSKYATFRLPAKDRWGVLTRRDGPLGRKRFVTPDDLCDLPLVVSHQLGVREQFRRWFGRVLPNLDIAASYNLLYNASFWVREGIGHALALDKLAFTDGDPELVFKPLKPAIEVEINLAWKRNASFSPAARAFLEDIRGR